MLFGKLNKMKIPKKLGKPILDWIENQDNLEKALNEKPPQHGGYVIGARNLNIKDKKLSKLKFPYSSLKTLNEYILKGYGLDINTPHDEGDGIFMSYSTKGHSVHIHQDKNPDNKHTHVRFNYLLSKPKGGDPIIEGKVINVKKDETWVCIAGNLKHGTTKITGNKPRIMISFGHYINNKNLNKII